MLVLEETDGNSPVLSQSNSSENNIERLSGRTSRPTTPDASQAYEWEGTSEENIRKAIEQKDGRFKWQVMKEEAEDGLADINPIFAYQLEQHKRREEKAARKEHKRGKEQSLCLDEQKMM